MAKIKVVTIGRRFCTGGSEIGKMVAEKLGVKCYDRELVEKAAEMVGVSMAEVAKNEESMMNWLKTPITLFGQPELTLAEKIFAAESELILDICSKESCNMPISSSVLIAGRGTLKFPLAISVAEKAKCDNGCVI